MPADDDEIHPEELDDLAEEAEGELEAEPDAEELDDEEDATFPLDDEDEDAEVVDEVEEEDEEADDADEAPSTRTKRRVAGDEEEDEDDELLSPDDVEADLDRILKDRLVTTDDEDDEDEDEDEPDERGETGDRLQPKRADEQLCPNCFLLVRANAPGCPVGDDDCPIFT